MRGYLDLTWRLFVRNLRSYHRKSIFGLFWLILAPIANTAIWVLLHAHGVISFDDASGLNYTVFTLTGILYWQMFLDGLLIPFRLMDKYQEIIRNLRFDHLAIMGGAILESIFNAGIRWVLIILFAYLLGASVAWQILLSPIPILILLMLGWTFSLLLMPLYLLYKDVARLLGFATQFAFFMTPIIYQVPEKGPLADWVFLNPMAAPLVLARDLTLLGSSEQWGNALIVACIFTILFLFGLKVFQVTCLRIVERI